jgi:hypothetical protein
MSDAFNFGYELNPPAEKRSMSAHTASDNALSRQDILVDRCAIDAVASRVNVAK